MDPKQWGPPFWFTLHTISLNYPFFPSEEEKSRYRNFFHSFEFMLPCSACRQHYTEHLVEHPISNALANRRTLVTWVVTIHNRVNRVNGKKEWSVEDAVQLYEKLLLHKIELDPPAGYQPDTCSASQCTSVCTGNVKSTFGVPSSFYAITIIAVFAYVVYRWRLRIPRRR